MVQDLQRGRRLDEPAQSGVGQGLSTATHVLFYWGLDAESCCWVLRTARLVAFRRDNLYYGDVGIFTKIRRDEVREWY